LADVTGSAEPPGRVEQQRRSIAAHAGGERDLPAQQVRPGTLQLIQRPGLGRGHQIQRPAERASLQDRWR
jgi:hypothetical protein